MHERQGGPNSIKYHIKSYKNTHMYREQEYLLKAQLILAKLCLVVCGFYSTTQITPGKHRKVISWDQVES